MKALRFILVIVACCPLELHAQTAGVLGLWTEPTGSTIEIYRCNNDVCARLVALSPKAPSRFDTENPDTSLRTKPLCGLVIGHNFHLADPEHAEDGHLYDPKTGKTYRGTMTRTADRLELRGYVGFKMFGRSETWTQAKPGVARCDKS